MRDAGDRSAPGTGVADGARHRTAPPWVLVANEPRSYRELLARVLPELRPGLLVRALEPAELDEVVAGVPTALVVCSELSAAVRAHAPAWLLLYPGGADRAEVGGHAILHPGLDDVLAAVDAALEAEVGAS